MSKSTQSKKNTSPPIQKNSVNLEANNTYLMPELLSQIKTHCLANGHVQLTNVTLNFEQAKNLVQTIELQEKKDPIHFHYFSTQLDPNFFSVETLNVLSKFIPLEKPKLCKIELIKLIHKNYSMMTDEDEMENRLYDVILDLSTDSADIVYLGDDNEPIHIESQENALTIIKANPYFYQYLNHRHKEKLFLKFQFS
jgi:hypothetical protein